MGVKGAVLEHVGGSMKSLARNTIACSYIKDTVPTSVMDIFGECLGTLTQPPFLSGCPASRWMDLKVTFTMALLAISSGPQHPWTYSNWKIIHHWLLLSIILIDGMGQRTELILRTGPHCKEFSLLKYSLLPWGSYILYLIIIPHISPW